MKSANPIESVNSRSVMLATIIMFSVLFLTLIIGMLIPLFANTAFDAGWFNDRTMLPTLLLALLLGVCLLLPDISPARILVMVAVVIVVTVLSGAVSPFNNTPIDISLPVLLFSLLAIAYRISRLPRLTLRSVSPHIIHIGIVLILIGIFVSTNMRIDGSTVIRDGELGIYEGQPCTVKITGISSRYEGAPYEDNPGSSYVTRINFELYRRGRLIDRDEVKFITDFKWGQSYATNYIHRSLISEVFVTTKMVEGEYVNIYMRTAPWITAVWGGIIIMSLGIVLLMYSVRTGKEGVKAAETIKGRKKGTKKENIGERGEGEEKDDIDRKYEEMLQTELDELKKN